MPSWLSSPQCTKPPPWRNSSTPRYRAARAINADRQLTLGTWDGAVLHRGKLQARQPERQHLPVGEGPQISEIAGHPATVGAPVHQRQDQAGGRIERPAPRRHGVQARGGSRRRYLVGCVVIAPGGRRNGCARWPAPASGSQPAEDCKASGKFRLGRRIRIYASTVATLRSHSTSPGVFRTACRQLCLGPGRRTVRQRADRAFV